MADLDDLLDEVERDLNNFGKKKNRNSSQRKPTEPATNPLSHSLDEDVDFILDETEDVGRATTLKAKGELPNTRKENATRCSSVYIGGTKAAVGCCTLSKRRCCDRLRCTSCDFKVERFPNLRWKEDTDYLFLRNNMPDFAKLSKKLIRKEGSCAYACQCSRDSAVNVAKLSPSLKWVCSKH